MGRGEGAAGVGGEGSLWSQRLSALMDASCQLLSSLRDACCVLPDDDDDEGTLSRERLLLASVSATVPAAHACLTAVLQVSEAPKGGGTPWGDPCVV